MVQMPILATTVISIYIILTSSFGLIKLVITGITAENILGTRFNRMQFPNRSREVHLESLFHRIRFSIRMEVLQQQIIYDILPVCFRFNIQVGII